MKTDIFTIIFSGVLAALISGILGFVQALQINKMNVKLNKIEFDKDINRLRIDKLSELLTKMSQKKKSFGELFGEIDITDSTAIVNALAKLVEYSDGRKREMEELITYHSYLFDQDFLDVVNSEFKKNNQLHDEMLKAALCRKFGQKENTQNMITKQEKWTHHVDCLQEKIIDVLSKQIKRLYSV